ncbi:MAG: hypothetical protein JWM54_1358, partial [Acidobacteriaceae bacterium]|nr:hypothetical protein [Acidobacteriaceae bacterium]
MPTRSILAGALILLSGCLTACDRGSHPRQ